MPDKELEDKRRLSNFVALRSELGMLPVMFNPAAWMLVQLAKELKYKSGIGALMRAPSTLQ